MLDAAPIAPTESPACALARAHADGLLRPIAADARAGRDARDDPRAEFLRDEMLKDGYARRDWPRIEEAARSLLSDATKDLVVAAAWASAAYETDGLPGLAAGLSLLAGLLADYWDEMFPPLARRKARESALDNFYEHIGTRLRARVVRPDDADDLSACNELLEALHRAAQTRYTPAPPPHRPVREALAQLRASLPKPASPPSTSRPAPTSPPAARPAAAAAHEPNAAPSPVSSDSATDPAPPSPPAKPAPEPAAARVPAAPDAPPLAVDAAPRAGASVEELTRSLGAATQHLPKIAAGLRRQQPEAPLPYRLLRFAAWLRAAEPPADSQGRTAVDPLPPATRAQCDAMAGAGRWSELLTASESAFAAPPHRFALDLQRHTATALAGLGHHDARTAVLAELAALLRRMPGLPRLLARDGTPLADPDTLAFLTRERITADLSPGPAPPPTLQSAALASPPAVPPTAAAMPSHPSEASPLSTAPVATPGPVLMLAARQRLAAGDRTGALTVLQQAAETAADPRQRFHQRIDLALLAHEAGLVPVARAQLAALEREAAERHLADWEPQLLARVLDPLLAILRSAPRSTDAADTQRLFDLLCTLDPMAASRHSAQ